MQDTRTGNFIVQTTKGSWLVTTDAQLSSLFDKGGICEKGVQKVTLLPKSTLTLLMSNNRYWIVTSELRLANIFLKKPELQKGFKSVIWDEQKLQFTLTSDNDETYLMNSEGDEVVGM
ncbi:MAG: hypothetical protein WCJ70_04910 [bacterium]